MPAWQGFVVAVLCWVVFFVVERLEAPFWLVLPAAIVMIACVPGVVEFVVKRIRGNGCWVGPWLLLGGGNVPAASVVPDRRDGSRRRDRGPDDEV